MSQTTRTKVTKVEQPHGVGCTGIKHKARRPTIADPSFVYHETLWSAVEAAWFYQLAFIEYYEYGVPGEDLQTYWERWTPMYREQTQTHNVKVKHPTKKEHRWKWISISIYRMDSGRYEVVSYVS